MSEGQARSHSTSRENLLATIHQERAEQLAALARLDGKVETLNATVAATFTRHSDELRVLFSRFRENDQKVQQVLLTYVTQAEFDEHVKLDRAQKDVMTKAIDGLKWKVAMASGAMSLVSFLAGFAIKALEVFK